MVSTVTETWWYDLEPRSGEETTTVISKGDTYIEDLNVNDAHGVDTFFNIGTTAAGNDQRALFQIKFPEAPENAGRIVDTRLVFYQITSAYVAIPVGLTIYFCDLEPKYLPGITTTHAGTGYGATWTTYDGHNAWVAAERNGEAVRTIKSTTDGNDASDIEISLDNLVAEEGLTWGSTIDMLIRTDDGAAGDTVQFGSMNSVVVAQRPRIKIEYELVQQEIPDSKDEILTIEPNPANPTQPLLKWKTPDNFNLRLDNSGGFVLVKSETIIDAITDGTLIARINQGEEYIDTGGILATTENNLYYYKLYFCSEGDYIAGTGTGLMSGMTVYGTPTPSNQVWMIRPDVSTFVFDDYTPDVKQQVTATITAATGGDFASTPSPVQHTKYQFDWKGDSTEVGWVELDTPANSLAKTHYYLGFQGATSAKARIENSLGFWSDATNSGSTVTVAAITGIPLVNVSPKAMTTSEVDLRVLGDQSYARSSNETITKYEFRVQRSSDNWYYDAAGPPYWVAGSTWNDLLLVPYMDIALANMDTAATYTCEVRITTSSFGLSSTTDSTTMTVTTETSTDMKATLTSSNFDTQNLGRQRRISKHRVVEGTSDTVINSGISSPSMKVSGHCYGSGFQTDYNQLQTWEDSNTLLKIYTDPQAAVPAKFIEGYIRNLRVTKRLSMNIFWDCDFVVKNATL